jgi:hypothetical protein
MLGGNPPVPGVTVNVLVADAFPDSKKLVDERVMAKFWTVSVTAALVTELKFASPLYVAVIEWPPAARVVGLKTAVDPLSAADPMEAPPSKNTTEPVGELTEDVTVAVSVTAFWAKTVVGDPVRPNAGTALLTVKIAVFDPEV